MIVPSFTAECAIDGSFLRLRNTSTGVVLLNVTAATLTITRPGLPDYTADLIASGKLSDSLTVGGIQLTPSLFTNTDGVAIGERFADGYYQLSLSMNDGTAVSASANEAFTSTVNEVLNRRVFDSIGDSVDGRSTKQRQYAVAQALIRSARADGRAGLALAMDAKISHVYRIFAMEGMSYGQE